MSNMTNYFGSSFYHHNQIQNTIRPGQIHFPVLLDLQHCLNYSHSSASQQLPVSPTGFPLVVRAVQFIATNHFNTASQYKFKMVNELILIYQFSTLVKHSKYFIQHVLFAHSHTFI